METFENAVKKVVGFWVEKSFRTLLNQNNGDDSPQGGMTFLLMNMVAMENKKSVTEEKIKLFEEKLSELLIKERNGLPLGTYPITLDVDYHPSWMLAEAADYAKIDSSCFPCKTFSLIKLDNSVEAKFQYAGKLVKL